MAFPSDLQIAGATPLKPIADIAGAMGIGAHLLEHYGESVAKIRLGAIDELADRPRAKYVLVSAVTPTPHGDMQTMPGLGVHPALETIDLDSEGNVVGLTQSHAGP